MTTPSDARRTDGAPRPGEGTAPGTPVEEELRAGDGADGAESRPRHGLVEEFDSDLGSARVDRGEWDTPHPDADPRRGGHPERAARQQRSTPPEELVGTAGPGLGEPGDEDGPSGQDVGSMDGEAGGTAAGPTEAEPA
ncbi:hypothetical protein [Thalassiella azotivora]